MTKKDRLKEREFQLELEANGVMSAISKWEVSENSLLRAETITSLSITARILMARAAGIREYLERN